VPSELAFLDVNVAKPLDALFEAVRRRLSGERFIMRFHELDHPRAPLAAREAARVIETIADPDERLAAFRALADALLPGDALARRAAPQLNRRILQTVREIAMLADGVAVRSWAEHYRFDLTCDFTAEPFYVDGEADRTVPDVVAVDVRDAVVVWAPATPPSALVLVAFALEELRAPVFIVSADGKAPALRARFVGYDAAADVLARAAVIVDPSLNPSNAVELAKCGVPLVVSMSSGAVEFLDGVGVFTPWNHTDLLRVVQSAFATGAPVPRLHPGRHEPTPRVWEPDVTDGPLVSILMRTYNRPQSLERALESVERQTYRNIEVVVVSDAGEDVSEIVARFPRARLVVHETNRGAIRAANTALYASRGDFVGILDDDDVLFPDHVSTLVAVLERSGADIAHSDAISAFYDVASNPDAPYGYSIFLNKPGEPTDLYITDGIGPMAALFRRTLALDVGGYDENLPHCEDWDMWIRLSQRTDFVHVPRVTAMYSIRNDDTNMMSYNTEGFKRAMMLLKEKYPLDDRPLLAQVRDTSMGRFAAQAGLPIFPAPALKRR
jgi:hypothetical protein